VESLGEYGVVSIFFVDGIFGPPFWLEQMGLKKKGLREREKEREREIVGKY
jgi:hypothetical protein